MEPHMKQLLAFAGALALNLIAMGGVFAAQQNPQLPIAPTSINVRDYGAQGDGVTDDTRAIQKAVNACADQDKKWAMRVEHWGHLTKGAIDNPHGKIVFPAGNYKISSPVVLGRFVYLRGLGEATIRQSDPAQDSFYFHGVQQAVVENLNFQGGKTQLRFWTNNIGIAMLNVLHCTFSDSSSYAVECRSYTQQVQGLNDTRSWAPYQVSWTDGVPALTPNAPDNLKPWFNSTITDISHCRFENVMHAIDLSGDTAVIRDCEVVTNPQMEGAVFRLADLIHLYRIKGTARLNPDKHQYWIETAPSNFYASVSLRDSTLDTDNANGMCLIRSDLLPFGTSIILENSRIKSAGSREGALLFVKEGTEPNIISINNVTEISGQPVKAVAWEKTPDAATLERIKDQPRGAVTEVIYKLQIAGNSASVDSRVPEIFQRLLLPPIPATAFKETYVPALSWSYADLEMQALNASKILLASEYGVDQNPATDDTANIQKVFDAAAKQGNGLVIFPSGVLTLSDTIRLPPRVVVRAAGTVSFVQSNAEKDLFEAKDSQQIAFKNCAFNGGQNGVRLHSGDNQQARLAFENCSFYDQTENGIQARAGEGEIGEINQTELRVQGGIMGTMHGLTTNAGHSQLDAVVAINDPRLNDDAFIRNLGGQMRVEAMLTNPKLWQGKRSEGKVPENITDWQLSKNTRWIDNWGKFYSLDARYGGECGGMCNVVNRSTNGTIFISGGNARFYNGVTRKCILYLEKDVRQAILQNISSPAAKIEDAWAVMNADGGDGRRTPGVVVRGVPAP
jgi:hypothetical protein